MLRLIYFICLLFVVSCDSTQKVTPPVEDKSFTVVDAHKVLVLKSGSMFQITLPSNPTTGYDWSVAIESPDMIKMQSKNFVADQSGRVGVGGDSRWVFQTANTGNSTISFSYLRPWEKDVKPSKVVTFELDVR